MFAVFLHHLLNSLLPPLASLSPQSIIDVPWNRCVDSLCYDIGSINLFDFPFWMAKQIYNFIFWWEKKENDKISMFTEHGWKFAKKWMDFLYKSKLFSFPFSFYLPLSWKRAKRKILESFQYEPTLFCVTAILAKKQFHFQSNHFILVSVKRENEKGKHHRKVSATHQLFLIWKKTRSSFIVDCSVIVVGLRFAFFFLSYSFFNIVFRRSFVLIWFGFRDRVSNCLIFLCLTISLVELSNRV